VRIQEFRIFGYGPLRDTGIIKLGDFSILWGKNEEGKTLILDAILKLLIKNKHHKIFSSLDRVSHLPDGYVLLEYKGKVRKLPSEGYLSDSIPAEDFRNVFVIRDSDLSIMRDYYSELTQRLTSSKVSKIEEVISRLLDIAKLTDTGKYRNRAEDFHLKDRITKANNLLPKIKELIGRLKDEGFEKLHIELIKKKKELKSINNKLEDLRLANKREKFLKGKSLLDSIKRLLKNFEKYRHYTEEELGKWRKLEVEVENKESLLKRKREELKKLESVYYDLSNKMEEFKHRLEQFVDKKELANILRKSLEEREKLEKEMLEYKRRLDVLEKELREIKKNKEEIDGVYNYIESKKIYDRIDKIKNGIDISRFTFLRRFIFLSLFFILLVSGFSVVGGIFYKVFWLVVIGIMFGVLGLGVLVFLFFFLMKQRVEDNWERIISELSPLSNLFGGVELNKDNIEYYLGELKAKKEDIEIEVRVKEEEYKNILSHYNDIIGRMKDIDFEIMRIVGNIGFQERDNVYGYNYDIAKVISEYEEINREKNIISGRLESLAKQINGIEKEISELESEVNRHREEIETLRNRYFLENSKKYFMKLQEKDDILKELSNLRSALRMLLDYENDDLDIEIKFWDREIKELEEYRDKASLVEYNEVLEQKLLEKEREIRDEIEKLQAKILKYRSELQNIAVVSRDILVSEGGKAILSPIHSSEDIVCESIEDLQRIYYLLDKFIKDNKERKRLVSIAKEIFSEIKEKEEERVKELFSKDSVAIRYFKWVTGGLYKDVFYDLPSKMIKVRREDGTLLNVNQLSGGALDQLYFAIRLSLSQKIVGERAFFLLDDPFIKSDPYRLEKLFSLLYDLAKDGWQIIYFSSKKEVKELYEREYKDKISYVYISYLY